MITHLQFADDVILFLTDDTSSIVGAKPFSILYLLGLKRQRQVKRVWCIVVSAVVWSIWLARNDFVFNKVKIKERDLQKLIFIQIAKWGEASKIMTYGMDPLWNINPVGAINVHHNKDMVSYWKFKYEAYNTLCMFDAAWHCSTEE